MKGGGRNKAREGEGERKREGKKKTLAILSKLINVGD